MTASPTTRSAQESQTYLLGSASEEAQRLVAQAHLFLPDTEAMLDRTGIQNGGSAIDLACGPIGILEPLARRVGRKGRVFGLDRNESFLQLAREQCARRDLPQVELMQGDALATGLPEHGFDLVHARLLLVHLRDPLKLVREAIRLARPGGVIALHEVDWTGWRTRPGLPAWDALQSAARAVFESRGQNVAIGGQLPGLMRRSGLRGIEVTRKRYPLPLGERKRLFLLDLVRSLRGPMLRDGLLTESELARLEGEVQDHLLDPATEVVSPAYVQVTGRTCA